MVELLPLQLQTMVYFGFVGKNQAVSYFAQKKIVICIRELVLYIPCAPHIRNLPGYVWSKTQRKIIMDDLFSYVLSERVPASYGNGETYLKVRDRYVDMEWCAVNEKSRNMVRIKTVCFTAVRGKTLVVSPNSQEPRVINTGIVLFSNPLQYQYMIEETGETFNSSKSNTKEAYDEFRRFGLTSELHKIYLL